MTRHPNGLTPAEEIRMAAVMLHAQSKAAAEYKTAARGPFTRREQKANRWPVPRSVDELWDHGTPKQITEWAKWLEREADRAAKTPHRDPGGWPMPRDWPALTAARAINSNVSSPLSARRVR
jgi:hypothetical protein